MSKQKKKLLTQRVVLSLCTAGVIVLSAPNAVGAAEVNAAMDEQIIASAEIMHSTVLSSNLTFDRQLGDYGIFGLNGNGIRSNSIDFLNISSLSMPFIHAGAGETKAIQDQISTDGTGEDGDHILAEDGGKITILKSDFKADVAAKGTGSNITITESTVDDAYAYGGGTIIGENSNFSSLQVGQHIVNGDTPEIVPSGSIKLTGGTVNDYIFATDNGTITTTDTKITLDNIVAQKNASISITGDGNGSADAPDILAVAGIGDEYPVTINAISQGQISLNNVYLKMTKNPNPGAEDMAFIHADGVGSSIELNGVSGNFSDSVGDAPEIFAENGSHIDIKNSNLNLGNTKADIAVKGNGSIVNIHNSTVEDLDVYEGGSVISVDSILGAVHAGQNGDSAYTSGTVAITGGTITDYVTAGGKGTVTISDAVLEGDAVDGHAGGTVTLKGKTTMTTGNFKDAAGVDIVGTIGAMDSGTVNIEGGTYGTEALDVRLITQNSGKINLSGGKLYTHQFAAMQDKSLVLSGSGNLITTSGTVFEYGIDGAHEKDWASRVTNAGRVYNNKIDFQGGSLSLDDQYYTKEYMTSARTSLNDASHSKTALEMLGEMTEAHTGGVVTEIGIDEIPDNVYLHNVSGTTDDKNLVIGLGVASDSLAVADKDFGVKNINLGTADTVLINNDKSIALYQGDLIQSTADNTTVMIGDTNGTGTLSLGGEGNSATNKGSIKGTVHLENGTIAVKNGEYSLDKLTGTKKGTITVGDAYYSASLTVKEAELNGATLFLDPVWRGNDVISDASNAAVIFKDNVDGHLVVGQNSVLSLGTNDKTLAEKSFTDTGAKWGEDGTTAALYVDTMQTIEDDNHIVVDGALSSNTGHTGSKFAANSMLMINAKNINGANAAFSGVTPGNVNFSVDEKSQLYIANTNNKAGEAPATYKIFGDNITASGFWQDDQIISNALSKNTVDGNNVITVKRENANKVYSGITLANTLDKMNIDTESKNAGEAYLSKLIEGNKYGDAAVGRTINAAAQIAQTVGVTKTSIDAVQSTADTVNERLSLTNDSSDEQGQEIWAKYIHNKTKTDSLSLAGNIDAHYDSSYNGFVIGSDFKTNDRVKSGVAFSYGTGDSNSEFASDDFKFWGLTIYSSIKNDDKNFIYDFGYTRTDHDVTGLGISASPDTDIWTLGVRGEKAIQNGNTKYIPYLGLRYMNVNTGSYNGTVDGKSAFDYDAGKQNIWLLPIGINISQETKTASGWSYRPSVDLSYVFNFGDHQDDMTVKVPGVNTSDTFNYDVTDKGAFVAKLGFEATRENWKIGIGYSRQESSDSSADRVYADVSFQF